MADPSKASAALAQLPPCVQAAALEAVTQTTCGLDIACVCKKVGYGFVAQLAKSPSARSCSPEDIGAALYLVPQICASAAPSLKEDRSNQAFAAVTALWALAVTAVILRLISRKISNAKFGLDDYLIILGMIAASSLSLCSLFATRNGAGSHMIMLSLDQITKFSKFSFASQLSFGVSITATKLSLLFFYHRVFPIKAMKMISIITGAIMLAWCFTLIFLVTFSCHPVSFAWDKSIPNGHCLNPNTVYVTLAGVNIGTDLVVLILPMPWLARLQLDLTKKLALIGTFVLGCFVCVVYIILSHPASRLWHEFLGTVFHLAIWINVECNLGIVCTCLPVMRTLVQRLYSSSFRSRFSRSHSSYNGQKGSQRLTDDEGSRLSQKRTVTSTAEGARKSQRSLDIGGLSGVQKSWFSGTKGSRNDSEVRGSMEEMVPVGKITVRHDLEWSDSPLDRPSPNL